MLASCAGQANGHLNRATVSAHQSACGGSRLLPKLLSNPLFRQTAGPPGRLLVNRCGSFPLRLVRDGHLIVRGSCYVHALQFQNYYWIEDRLQQTSLRLAPGRWVVEDAVRQGNGSGGAGSTKQSRIRLNSAGLLTAVSVRWHGVGGPRSSARQGPIRMPSRIACGVLVGHPAPAPVLFNGVFKVFATIAWPSFKFLGTNVPVIPGQTDGGLGFH